MKNVNQDESEKEQALNSLTYFWENKGDLERCVCFEEYIAYFPEIKVAWENYKLSKKILSAVIKGVNS